MINYKNYPSNLLPLNFPGNSSCIDVEIGVYDECEERIRKLFTQALLVFLEEEDSNHNRPLPVILGNGETVDLFKMFVLVREREGSDSVSKLGLWGSVAEKLGLDCSVSPSLRLVYSKYLDRMEKWSMEESKVVNWDSLETEEEGCHGDLLHELGDGFKDLLENGNCGKRNRAMVFGCKHIEEPGSELDRPRKRLRESSEGNDDVVEELEASRVVVIDKEEEGSDLSLKKKGDLPEMLKWLSSVAACPQDPSIGVLPHWSQWKEYTGNECWIQAARAKKALLVQRDDFDQRYQDALIMGYQTMHPSMYDEGRKSRFSILRPNLSKAGFRRYNNGSLVPPGSNNCRDLVPFTPSERTNLIARRSGASKPNKLEFPRRYVAVGRNFQAQVDDFTESGLDSDTKWLGTRVWPLENKEDTLGGDLIGKGRLDGCSCRNRVHGSVECVRFHIAEKRMELKRELGDAFFRWRFNQMGEEVSLRWTEREEKKFKEEIMLNPQSFWDYAAMIFRGKKREELVCYFFNVFLINRIRYQNRVTPCDVDSDDERDFGAVGNGFGRDAVSNSGSNILICRQSRQCLDFE